MNICFRCDSSREIGSGHSLRAISIASSLFNSYNLTSSFISTNLSGNVNEKIPPFCDSYIIPSAGKYCSKDEINFFSKFSARFDWIIIDGYHIPEECIEIASLKADRCLIFNDTDKKFSNKYEINTTLISASFDHDCRSNRFFSGPEYSPLPYKLVSEGKSMRKNFLSLQNVNARKSVVISLGGSDILNLTSFLCSSIAQACPEIDIYFTAPKHFCVKKLKSLSDYKNIFHIDSDSFHNKMPLFNVAIIAGGLTSYEFAYLGTPMIILPVNYIQTSNSLLMESAIRYCTVIDPNKSNVLPLIIQNLNKMISIPTYHLFNNIGIFPFDGLAVNRIYNILISGLSKTL